MKAGTKLLENGVEVSLYPDTVLSAIPHQDRIAIDFGGKQLNVWCAPCKLVVKKLMADYHGVILWTVNPVLTPSGLTHYSLWLMHDNDVTDLTVGKVIEQGMPFYQEGGWGANGAKTYATHIHCNCAKGHTTQGKPNANGKYELVGSVWANELFYLDGTETIVNYGGLTWATYQAQEIVEIAPVEETSPIVADPVPSVPTNDIVEAPTKTVTPEVDVTVDDVTPTETPQIEPVPEPVAPIIEEPKEQAETQPNINVAPKASNRLVWFDILKIIIEFILKILKGNR